MGCPPPGPENEAGRPNSYGQPQVQQKMRIINDDYGADGYNSHGSDHDNVDADDYDSHGSDHDNNGGGDDYDVNQWRRWIAILVLTMLNYWLALQKQGWLFYQIWLDLKMQYHSWTNG